MDYQRGEENKCRICLQEDVIVNWNDFLKDRDHLTYKDCYYKYTQLDCFDRNNLYLSAMLCRDCSDGLENINTFITKAIETHNVLEQRLALHIEYKQNNDKNLETNFETILFSETCSDNKAEIHNARVYHDTSKENLNEESDMWSTPKDESTTNNVSMFDVSNKECLIEESDSWIITEDIDSSKLLPLSNGTSKESLNEDIDSWIVSKDNETYIKISRSKRKIKSMLKECKKDNTKTSLDELQSDRSIPKEKRNCKTPRETPTCCSICSKVLSSKYKAIQHEQTHVKNRKRNEVCAECGMKFYNKPALRSHMLTHMKNREKTHKCEFCDKAFYNSGARNIHRRIHLGQMIKCSLCTKEYYRQSQLDNHMVSHSAARISADLKSKKKYFVRCEICEENVRSTQYKSHSAKHMNEPLVKCAICNKEFFSRHSCDRHLKKVHKKGSGERSNFIIAYKTTRYSNLFLQQNVGKIITKE